MRRRQIIVGRVSPLGQTALYRAVSVAALLQGVFAPLGRCFTVAPSAPIVDYRAASIQYLSFAVAPFEPLSSPRRPNVQGKFMLFNVHFSSEEFQMSSSQQRVTTATDRRLAVVISAAANLKAQLCELNELRERVRKELLSARKSPQPKRRNAHGAISRSSLEIDSESAFGRSRSLSE